jgi:hypothetical protein
MACDDVEFEMHFRHLAARSVRVVHELSAQRNRGRGECRVPVAPAASCAVVEVAHECSHHGRTGTPGIPARNGFNGLYRALPGDEFVLVTVIGGLRFCQARSGSQNLRQLSISNGCQDHTASPSATTSFVSVPSIAHRFFDLPCHHVTRPMLPRPPHPIPRP